MADEKSGQVTDDVAAHFAEVHKRGESFTGADVAAEFARRRAETACGAANEHDHMATVEHLRRCPICNLRFSPAEEQR